MSSEMRGVEYRLLPSAFQVRRVGEVYPMLIEPRSVGVLVD